MDKEKIFRLFKMLGADIILRTQKKNTVTVLSLHRVSPENDFFWNPLKPATFEKIIQHLKKYYTIISFAEINEINAKPAKPFLVLSFDDGYYDFYEYALPLLKKYKVPSNHNIVNKCAAGNYIIWTQRMNCIFSHCRENDIDLKIEFANRTACRNDFKNDWMQFYLDTYRTMLQLPAAERMPIIEHLENSLAFSAEVKMMNWQQVNECAANDVEIGCHTYSHDVLSTIKSDAVLRDEIVLAANELRSHLKKDINILALPNGKDNPAILKFSEEAGIEYILNVDDKINKWKDVKAKGIKNIYRINMVEEPMASMILRTELLHSKLKRYV
ncbi:MAG: polysaccharide deacetylase family protein [Ferruginibacter sp.]